MEVRRIAVRESVRMLVVARGLTALCLPGAVWWKTDVVGDLGQRPEWKVERRARAVKDSGSARALAPHSLQLWAAMGAV